MAPPHRIVSNMSARVAIIHDWLNGMRGGEKVLEVICELFPDAPVFTLFHEPARLSATLRAARVVASPLNRIAWLRRRYRMLLPILPRLMERFDLRGFDAVISSSHCVAKGAIPRPGAPHVCYCHSPMRYVWDLYDTYRAQARGLSRAALPLFRRRLQRWDVATAPRVSHFIANSRHIAAKIQRYYGREAAVVPPPVDCAFYQPGAGPLGDYYLVCSALVPYKRVDLAIAACRRLERHLIVAGDGPDRGRLERLGDGGVIEFTTGWVSDERLRTLYGGCRALLFPGEEDFGITPLEAMACGRPVIAYRKGGALETVVEGRTGLFFDEQTPEAMAAAIERFEAMAFDPAMARARAVEFDRPAFREKLSREIYRSLGFAP